MASLFDTHISDLVLEEKAVSNNPEVRMFHCIFLTSELHRMGLISDDTYEKILKIDLDILNMPIPLNKEGDKNAD